MSEHEHGLDFEDYAAAIAELEARADDGSAIAYMLLRAIRGIDEIAVAALEHKCASWHSRAGIATACDRLRADLLRNWGAPR